MAAGASEDEAVAAVQAMLTAHKQEPRGGGSGGRGVRQQADALLLRTRRRRRHKICYIRTTSCSTPSELSVGFWILPQRSPSTVGESTSGRRGRSWAASAR